MCSTLSNAALRSSSISIEVLPESVLRRMSFKTLIRASQWCAGVEILIGRCHSNQLMPGSDLVAGGQLSQ